MDREFRRRSLARLVKNAGIVADMVDAALSGDRPTLSDKPAATGFREQFLKMAPGPKREAFVLAEIKKYKPPVKLVPITIPGPNNTKVTYQVMPDYITLDGIRVPLAGQTAQKVADFYGMHLPTSKMSKQIWEAADTKIRPTPLSSGGRIGNKYYSGTDVVKSKIGDSDSALAYSTMIEEELSKHPNANLIAGHMKDIVAPEGDPDKLGLYGWYGKDGKPIQYSARTPHDTIAHTEYGAGTRLVGNTVTVTTADGRTVKTTMEDLMKDPVFSKTVTDTPGVKKYRV